MSDKFDINWGKYSKIVKGKYYTKKNDDRFNCYEIHCVEFSLNEFSILIEVFIQLMPTKDSYSNFLERYTKINLKSNQTKLEYLKIEHKGMLSKLFFKNDKTDTGVKEFDSKYKLKILPADLSRDLFDSEMLSFLYSKKIIDGNLEFFNNEHQNTITLKFPDILYTQEDIEAINKIINRLVKKIG